MTVWGHGSACDRSVSRKYLDLVEVTKVSMGEHFINGLANQRGAQVEVFWKAVPWGEKVAPGDGILESYHLRRLKT